MTLLIMKWKLIQGFLASLALMRFAFDKFNFQSVKHQSFELSRQALTCLHTKLAFQLSIYEHTIDLFVSLPS